MDPNVIEPQLSNHYEIRWLPKPSAKPGSIIGKVVNYNPNDNTEFYINIEKSNLDIKKTGFTIIASTWQTKKKINMVIPIIGATQFFINYPENVQDGLTWHEIGHIHHKHVLRNKLKQNELKEQRRAYILKNDVLPMELEADLFAAKNFGKSKYIEVLKYVKDHRPFEDTNADSEIGRREYDIRISKIDQILQ
jgi:hypothetical protein